LGEDVSQASLSAIIGAADKKGTGMITQGYVDGTSFSFSPSSSKLTFVTVCIFPPSFSFLTIVTVTFWHAGVSFGAPISNKPNHCHEVVPSQQLATITGV